MVYSVDVRIEVPVHDTEVINRVGDAVENIFPGVELNHELEQLVDEIHKLERLSERLHKQAILDTARREFAKRRDGDDFSFALKKQAAFKGVISFSVDNPDELGDIKVYVTVRDPSVGEVIDCIAPPTEEERPVDPSDR